MFILARNPDSLAAVAIFVIDVAKTTFNIHVPKLKAAGILV